MMTISGRYGRRLSSRWTALLAVVLVSSGVLVSGRLVASAAAAQAPWHWVHQLGTGGFDQGAGVAVDGSGNAYVTGDTGGTLPGSAEANAGGQDVFVAKYDTSGTKLWVHELGTTGTDFGLGVAVDGSGNAYLTGDTGGTLPGSAETNAGDSDVFVAQLGVLPTAPSAPTIGTATGLDASVRVAFTPGFDGGSPVTGFSATCVSSDSGTAGSASGSSSPILVSGLMNGAHYTCTVTATNAVGTGTPSAASNSVLVAGVPGAPTAVAGSPGNASAVVHWTTPSVTNGAAVTGYVVTAYRGTTVAKAVTFNSTATKQTITGLANGTAYTFKVAAQNVKGTGTQSAASAAVVPVITLVVTAGGSHSCALLPPSGTVKCWGLNSSGQLGDGTTTSRVTPVAVSGLSNASVLSAGGFHTCAVAAGTVKCWGRNASGQLGNGTTTNRLTPTSVSGLSGAVGVSAASDHTCARLSDGTAKCWGLNSSGQLGDGTTTRRLTPVTVVGLTGVTQIAAGVTHSCARLSDGTVKCWGANSSGQLGDGTTTLRLTPVAVVGLTGVSAIAARGSYTCALLSTATVKCWGLNSSGQLGDGTTTNRLTPVAVSGLSGVRAVTAGGAHTCAVLTNGSAKCWGANIYGQLGDATTTQRLTPVTVNGLSGALNVTGGASHTLARLNTGGLRAWGANTSGQLGNGATTNPNTVPVKVTGLS
jgi:alpha-tubulin suppressor-like RCC1 family protein